MRRISTRQIVYRLAYLVCLGSGHVAAWLAADYRTLARASRRWGGWVVPLQLPVLLAWCPVRALSLGSFALCEALATRQP
jgi:hypothetical protein